MDGGVPYFALSNLRLGKSLPLGGEIFLYPSIEDDAAKMFSLLEAEIPIDLFDRIRIFVGMLSTSSIQTNCIYLDKIITAYRSSSFATKPMSLFID